MIIYEGFVMIVVIVGAISLIFFYVSNSPSLQKYLIEMSCIPDHK